MAEAKSGGVWPPLAKQNPMRKLKHLFYEITTERSSPGWSVIPFGRRRELLRTLRLINEMGDNRFDLHLNEMFRSKFDDELLTYALRPEIMVRSAANHLSMKNQLLVFASACGWPCSDPALLQKRDLLHRVLNNSGAPDILHYAMQKVWTLEQFTQTNLEDQMKETQQDGR